MPGIVGIITKLPRSQAEPQLLKMVEALRHEKFYATGTWVDEQSGIYAGWVVRQNSFADGMPLVNEREDVSLIFSGEDFPELGTAKRLKGNGHAFEAEGPSYLVHRYEEDRNFFGNLNGRFHGLLTDRTKRTATLFNDRYGMHRIYYHEAKEAFYFGAEAKAILAVCPELRTPDYRSIGEFISCGCVLENKTIFRNIHVLPPASEWVFRDGQVERKGSYFQAREWEEQPPLDPEAYYQQLREVFTQKLPLHFQSRERVGMSLTGGLDTRMIMAWHKAAPGELPCYSFGGMFHECQDVSLARRVAEICGQKHQIIPVGNEFLSRFAHYAERTVFLTDGCMDTTHSPDLYVNERAAAIAPVRMTGNYGGEVLRRVRAFKPGQPAPGLYTPDFLSYVDEARATYGRLTEGHPLSFAVFKQAPWHHYGLLALEQTQLTLRSPYLDNDIVRTVFRAPQSVLTSNDISLRLIADGDTTLRKLRTDRGVGGNGSRWVAMAKRGYLEFTFKAEYAYDYGMPQWVARVDHTLAPLHLERLFLGRHKFYHFRVWYRDVLAAYVREMLLDSKSLARPYLDARGARKMVEGHLGGGRNYTSSIHKLLTLELIHRIFMDSQDA
ncbi:MAG: asparagine synthase-related protein [Terriglobales bacterium]